MTHTPSGTNSNVDPRWYTEKMWHHLEGKHHELTRGSPTTERGVLSSRGGWGVQNRGELVSYSVGDANGKTAKRRYYCSEVEVHGS